MKKIIILTFFILIFSNIYSQWVNVGPYGGRIENIIKKDNILFMISSYGLYSSTNNGIYWNSNNLSTILASVYSIGVSGNNLLAGINGDTGIAISTNNGNTWAKIAGSPGSITGFTNIGSYIFAWSNGHVLLSTNNGYNWNYKGTHYYGLSSQTPKYSSIGNNLLIGTPDSGIFISTNEGTNWTPINIGLTDRRIRSLTVNGSTIYAGTQNGGIFKSTNNGNSWINIGFQTKWVSAINFIGTNIFAGIWGEGIYKSTNNGLNWVEANVGNFSPNIKIIFNDGVNLFAGTSTNGVFISTNNGLNWLDRNSGLYRQHVTSFALSGSNIYAGTNGNGIYLSTNYGVNWLPRNFGIGDQQIWGFAISGTNMYAGSYYGGVYMSTNSGMNWTNIGLQLNWVLSLAVSGNNLIAGTTNKIYITSNNGVNWIQIMDSIYVNSLIKSGQNIYAATDEKSIMKSTNNGFNWTSLGSFYYVNCISISENNIFAGTSGGSIYKTTNDGLNWTSAMLNNYPTIWSIASSGSIVIAGSYANVYVSTDYGANWIIKSEGIDGNSYRMYAMLIANGYVFAGNDGSGIWKRSLADAIGINNISTEVPDKYTLSQNYPNPFNPGTTIKFQIKETGFVSLKVYDILGKEISTLVNEKLQAGTYEVPFSIEQNSSGIYFYRLETGSFSQTKKMVVLK